MTLGQRIQLYRKQNGMSQETLGDALGVSRQAVSKWEGDNGIPELSTLIAMSRLFSITIGQLLGVEEIQSEEKPASSEDSQLEIILHRYSEEYAEKTGRQNRTYIQWILAAGTILVGIIITLFVQIGSIRSTVNMLQSNISSLQVNVSNQQSSLSGQIRNTIYDVLAEEAKLLNTFEWELTDLQLEEQMTTIRLTATMKTYEAGSELQFYGNWVKIDETKGQSTGEWVQGPDFSAELSLPLNYHTDIGIRVRNENGDIQEQLVDYIYNLHPDVFRLVAYNLTEPFAISFHGFGSSVSTSKGEQAFVSISSPHSDFLWPEKVVMTATMNGEELFREELILQKSEWEANVFLGSIPDTYLDVSMKNGDVLEVSVTITDNYGRTEQYLDNVAIKNGKVERAPTAAPVISVVD